MTSLSALKPTWSNCSRLRNKICGKPTWPIAMPARKQKGTKESKGELEYKWSVEDMERERKVLGCAAKEMLQQVDQHMYHHACMKVINDSMKVYPCLACYARTILILFVCFIVDAATSKLGKVGGTTRGERQKDGLARDSHRKVLWDNFDEVPCQFLRMSFMSFPVISIIIVVNLSFLLSFISP